MSGWFNNIGQLAGLMRNMGKIREEAERFHARLAELHAEGSAGGEMVTVRVNGHMELVKVTLTPAAFELGDCEMLEDLIVSASNQAIAKMRDQIKVEAQSMAQNMGLPPGMNIPGVG